MTALTPDAIAKILGDCETGCQMTSASSGMPIQMTLRDALGDLFIIRNGPMRDPAVQNAVNITLLCIVADLGKRLKDSGAIFS